MAPTTFGTGTTRLTRLHVEAKVTDNPLGTEGIILPPEASSIRGFPPRLKGPDRPVPEIGWWTEYRRRSDARSMWRLR